MKSSKQNSRSTFRITLLAAGVIALVGNVWAAPQGGVVVGGAGTITTPNAQTTVITQNTQNMAINWSSFNVAQNELVQFKQPNATSVALNRIHDVSVSTISGQITANGRVVFLNGNGMLFTSTSQLNVGGLTASTLDISNDDFMANRFNFNAINGGNGAIINQGMINASSGSVALIGNSVSNQGLIVANAGSVTLAAGKSATLDFDGDGLLRVAVDSAVIENAAGVTDGVLNSGEINAGEVLLTAQASQDVFTNLVNNEGAIRAAHIDNTGGTIRLVGTGGDTVNSGTLDVSGVKGGEINVLGDHVLVTSTSVLDASGDKGGGTILVGGDYQGKGTTYTATDTTVENGARLKADAKKSGNGGKVIVWADDTTHFNGEISAKGGRRGGNGGLAEVSGKNLLDFGSDAKVFLGAVRGKAGTLLLDPDNILIVRDSLAVCAICDVDGDGILGEVPDDQLTGGLAAGDYPGMTSIISLRQLNDLLNPLKGNMNITLEATNSITLNAPDNTLGILFFNVNTLNLIAPDVNLYSHVHGTGLLNVVASDNLLLGVNLHFTELKPISLNGVDGMNSTLSGGKDFVITGPDEGTVKLVNGTLEDSGNANANIAHWYHFANIQGLSDADVPILAVQCPTCQGVGSATKFTFQPGGSLSGGILGLEANDTVVRVTNAVTVTKGIEIVDAALFDPSLQVFSTVDAGMALPCDQREEEGECDAAAGVVNNAWRRIAREQNALDERFRLLAIR